MTLPPSSGEGGRGETSLEKMGLFAIARGTPCLDPAPRHPTTTLFFRGHGYSIVESLLLAVLHPRWYVFCRPESLFERSFQVRSLFQPDAHTNKKRINTKLSCPG